MREATSYPTFRELAFQRLSVMRQEGLCSRSGIISFKSFFSQVCTTLRLGKEEAWNLARTLEAEGMIEIVPFHGVRLLDCQDN